MGVMSEEGGVRGGDFSIVDARLALTSSTLRLGMKMHVRTTGREMAATP
jgi:hypothetical protein